jgi:hypothetical protein
MMPKSETITAIMRINRSANAEFLSEFSQEELTRYLQRLYALPNTDRCITATQQAPSAQPVDDPTPTLQVRWM